MRAHRGRALSPERPFIRGTAQNPDVYFQARETEGYNDRADYASAGRNPQHASEESANHRANDADDDIDDQAKPTTFYDLSRQPAGDCSDNKPSDDPVFHPISPLFFMDE